MNVYSEEKRGANGSPFLIKKLVAVAYTDTNIHSIVVGIVVGVSIIISVGINIIVCISIIVCIAVSSGAMTIPAPVGLLQTGGQTGF